MHAALQVRLHQTCTDRETSTFDCFKSPLSFAHRWLFLSHRIGTEDDRDLHVLSALVLPTPCRAPPRTRCCRGCFKHYDSIVSCPLILEVSLCFASSGMALGALLMSKVALAASPGCLLADALCIRHGARLGAQRGCCSSSVGLIRRDVNVCPQGRARRRRLLLLCDEQPACALGGAACGLDSQCLNHNHRNDGQGATPPCN